MVNGRVMCDDIFFDGPWLLPLHTSMWENGTTRVEVEALPKAESLSCYGEVSAMCCCPWIVKLPRRPLSLDALRTAPTNEIKIQALALVSPPWLY
jgi:hypothetical protein